jgi:hypothetical protein
LRTLQTPPLLGVGFFPSISFQIEFSSYYYAEICYF